MHVEADIDAGTLEVVVSDRGRGFVPGSSPRLGLGLGLMRDSTTVFEIRDTRLGGVEVWMRSELAS